VAKPQPVRLNSRPKPKVISKQEMIRPNRRKRVGLSPNSQDWGDLVTLAEFVHSSRIPKA
jgi:hypothetical protein